jgi:hypothetical protein
VGELTCANRLLDVIAMTWSSEHAEKDWRAKVSSPSLLSSLQLKETKVYEL